MLLRITRSKFLLFFVSAFLCLNLSGASCLAYCQITETKAEVEHCPLAKFDKNCPNGKSENANDSYNVTNGTAADCCSLAINFFVAKLEKNEFSVQLAAAVDSTVSRQKRISVEIIKPSPEFFYRPPSLDFQNARLKNCVFRI